MARRKVIGYQSILDTAYQIVLDQGIHNLTARVVATELNCSTQPIYLEFKSMSDLKLAIYEKLRAHLIRYQRRTPDAHEDRVIALCLLYIDYAIKYPNHWRTLATNDMGAGTNIAAFVRDNFSKRMAYEPYCHYSDEQKEAMINIIWPTTVGLVSSIVTGVVEYDENNRTAVINALAAQLEWAKNQTEYPKLVK